MFLYGSRLVSVGLPVGHFSYVFVDEGGQAVEPECVIAIAGTHTHTKENLMVCIDVFYYKQNIKMQLVIPCF